MMHSCILCSNSSTRTVNRNITFHSFPRDPIRRARWLKALNRTDCTDWHRVCSEHFSPSDFRPGEKRLLWSFALPKRGLVPENSIPDDDDLPDNSSQEAIVNNQQNLNESASSVSNNMTASSSVIDSVSPRRSGRKIKPSAFSDDSTYVNTLNTSLIPSDQEMDENSKVQKKKKKKDTVSNGMRCAAKNCENKYPCSKLSFFSFPSDISQRKIWVKNCGIEDLVGPNCYVKPSFKVCTHHFEEDMFYNTLKKNRLVSHAVPTIFNDGGTSQQLSHSDSETIDIVKGSSKNDVVIIGSSDLSDAINLSLLWNNEFLNPQCQGGLEHHVCCIPGCIYSAEYLNLNTNANSRPVAVFTPSSVKNMNDWSSLIGIPLTMKSCVCEIHFNPEDISSKDIFVPHKGLSKIKTLKCNSLPVKINKYGGALKRSWIINDNEDVSIKKVKNNADESTSISKFSKLAEDENIKMIENDSSTSTLNSAMYVNNKSIDSLSKITSNSSIENDSQSSLEQILPKILANNSLSISLQPSVQQNKQVSITESTKVTNAVSGLNQNKKHIEGPSITSPHNLILTGLQSNFGSILPNKLTSNSSLSITVEKNTTQKAQISPIESDEVANSTDEIKPEPLDDEPQTIPPLLSDTSVTNTMPISSNQNFTKTVFPGGEIIGITILKSDDEVKPELHDNVPEANTLVDNSIDSTNSTFKSEPTDDVNDSQSNFKQPLPKSPSILLTALQSTCNFKKTSVNNSNSNTEYSECIQNEHELITAHEVSGSSSSIPINQEVIESPTLLKPSFKINNHAPSTLKESNSVKDFISDSKNAMLPNQYWLSYYNSSQNAVVFIQRDESLNPIKRVFFYNSFVPNIFINDKQYEYQTAVKSKCDLENLLEDIDDIMICTGYDGYAHETCIGYFETTSEDIEVCRNCRLLIKEKYLRKMDADLKTKTNVLNQLHIQISELKMRIANNKKHMLLIEKRRY